jgi:hypothetical protein
LYRWVVWLDGPFEQRSHQEDSSARTVVLVFECEVCRARLKAKPAMHAGVDPGDLAGERRVGQRTLRLRVSRDGISLFDLNRCHLMFYELTEASERLTALSAGSCELQTKLTFRLETIERSLSIAARGCWLTKLSAVRLGFSVALKKPAQEYLGLKFPMDRMPF